jgi:flagellar biosynthesis chaperone FliJ
MKLGRPSSGFDKVAYQREYMRKRRSGMASIDMASIEQQIDKLEVEIEIRKASIKELKKQREQLRAAGVKDGKAKD